MIQFAKHRVAKRERGVTMTIEEILAGESKNVEFKETLPEKSIKYMKSVVAFANGTGGKIIFGIADKTRDVVGFDKEDVFKKMDAIRELIINAMVHRSYLDHGTIQVAVYDNRLEITSPGKLPMGQTMERMKEGYSKIRNEALAHAFAYMNLIEHWGSGIPRIIDKVKAAGLREPEFIGGEVDLRINIYRGQVDGTVDLNNAIKVPDTIGKMPDSGNKVPDKTEIVPDNMKKMPDSGNEVPDTTEKIPDSEREQQIYKYVLENGSITTAETVEILDVKHRRARAVLLNMVKDGYLRKEGAARSTIYVKNTEGR